MAPSAARSARPISSPSQEQAWRADWKRLHCPCCPRARRHRLRLIFQALVTVGVSRSDLLWQLPGRTAVGDWPYLAVALVTLLLGMETALLVWLDGWSARRAVAADAAGGLQPLLGQPGHESRALRPGAQDDPRRRWCRLAGAVNEAGDDNFGLPGRVYNRFPRLQGLRHPPEVGRVGQQPAAAGRHAALFDEFPLDRILGSHRRGARAHLAAQALQEPSELLAEFPRRPTPPTCTG
ncbi:MAG: hypothetical protein R2854_19220 [Caldilineaceae bacterium]